MPNTFNKDAVIVAQNATTPAAQITAAIIMANPAHDGGTTTESALALFDAVHTHIFEHSMYLGGVENVIEFLGAAPVSQPRSSNRGSGNAPASSGGGKGTAGEYTLDFGKHKGKTVAQVHKEAPDYLTWILDKGKDEYVKTQVRAFHAS